MFSILNSHVVAQKKVPKLCAVGSKVLNKSKRPRRRVILRASAYGGRECPDEVERNIAPWVEINSNPYRLPKHDSHVRRYDGWGYIPPKNIPIHPNTVENLRRYDMEASGSARDEIPLCLFLFANFQQSHFL